MGAHDASAARPCLMLGIETSCDETAAAVVVREPGGKGRILSNVVRSQFDEHKLYGGVVPEIAARAHTECLDVLVSEALKQAGVTLDQVDGVAAASGPGLIGGLIVGTITGKALALAAGKPFFAINHLEAHALTAGLTNGIRPPYLMLLVSGGHTQILFVEGVGRYTRLATTIDDALGEAFDKTAKLLGLAMPGGPSVERAAQTGNPHRVVDRVAKAMRAVSGQFEGAPQKPFVAAGGVAANMVLRTALVGAAEDHGYEFHAPPLALCTDNGAMIAWAAAERFALGLADGLDAAVKPRWPLDPNAAPAQGAGVKA